MIYEGHDLCSAAINFDGTPRAEASSTMQIRKCLRPAGDQVIARRPTNLTAERGQKLMPIRQRLAAAAGLGERRVVSEFFGLHGGIASVNVPDTTRRWSGQR
ncbi:hypothetical protein DMB37_37390 [Nocardia sp. CS682]|nr:hypothetical protein DMB37_37390 [Nocardia sp. CS682]